VTKFGSFSFKVIKRILDILSEDGPLKKTNLATKAGLNFAVCKRYLELLDALGWVEVDMDVIVTQAGRVVGGVLLDPDSFKEMRLVKKAQETAALEWRKGAARSEINPGSPSPSQARTGGWRERVGQVIIVDDEPDVAFTFQSFLNGVCPAKAFSDPFEALKAFADRNRDMELAVLDIKIPEVNGLQLYQIFRVLNKDCKFLFVSSLDGAREVLSLYPEIGMSQIVKKPISREAFIQAVMGSLSKRKT
jgi:CheY-like chemotaxis protein/predicted transcriptional regulator